MVKKRTWAMIAIAGVLAAITILNNSEKKITELKRIQQQEQLQKEQEKGSFHKKLTKMFRPDAGTILQQQGENIKAFENEAKEIIGLIEELNDLLNNRVKEDEGVYISWNIPENEFTKIDKEEFLEREEQRIKNYIKEFWENEKHFSNYELYLDLQEERERIKGKWLDDLDSELPLFFVEGREQIAHLRKDIEKTRFKIKQLESLQNEINKFITKAVQEGRNTPELVEAANKMNLANEAVITQIELCNILIPSYQQALKLWIQAFNEVNDDLRKEGRTMQFKIE